MKLTYRGYVEVNFSTHIWCKIRTICVMSLWCKFAPHDSIAYVIACDFPCIYTNALVGIMYHGPAQFCLLMFCIYHFGCRYLLQQAWPSSCFLWWRIVYLMIFIECRAGIPYMTLWTWILAYYGGKGLIPSAIVNVAASRGVHHCTHRLYYVQLYNKPIILWYL